MSNLVPVNRQSSFEVMPSAYELAEKVARTEFVPGALRGKPDAIMACVLAGHEMGISPLKALQQIHVIDGRPSMSAELMRAVAQAHGHEVWVEESTNTRVTVCGQRAGSNHVQKVTWTLDDASKAGLSGKQNWRKYPRQMLLARASAELVRMAFPDVLAGLSYAKEEIEDGFDFDETMAEEVPAEPPTGSTRQLTGESAPKKRPAKKAAAKKAASTAAPAAPAVEDLPPLPGDDDVVDAEVVDAEVVEDPDVTKRAQQIAMKARDLGLDHHDVVAAVTGGRETSAKAINQAQAESVLEALREIKVGTKVLDVDGDVPRLVDAAPVEAPAAGDGPDLAEVASWDGDAWRAWLRTQGVRVVDVMREAKRLAVDAGVAEPMSLDDLGGSASLAAMVAGWVEGQAEESR